MSSNKNETAVHGCNPAISVLVVLVSHKVYFLAELSSGPKGRRTEPHNYRSRIEIKKTMRLSFYGHRG